MNFTETAVSLPLEILRAVRELTVAHLGIYYPDSKFDDLTRSLAGIRREMNFPATADLAAWLLAGPITVEKKDVLARHLTVGETYFFREPAMFHALAREVLPDILRQRRAAGSPIVKIWSAGCATGEEAYSLAISLARFKAELEGWDISISATDINAQSLQAAQQAIYKSWSFRGVDADIKRQFFVPVGKAYQVIADVRRYVSFSQVNLASADYPSPDFLDLDLIVCRNVLMYFAPDAARATIGRLKNALKPGGWLAVSAVEYSQALFKDFETVNFGNVFLYRKPLAKTVAAPRREGRTRNVRQVQRQLPLPAAPVPHDIASTMAARLARVAADRGALSEALSWTRRAIATDKTDAHLHYLHGQILLETGDDRGAAMALDRAIYLRPHFALAHFLRAIIAQTHGHDARAHRHFANARAALRLNAVHDAVDGADGLTVANLTDMIDAAAHRVVS
jgi:chemotaxis protein methyltransferase CheR